MFKLWTTSWNGPFYYNGLCNYTFPMHGSEDDPTTITWLLENGGGGQDWGWSGWGGGSGGGKMKTTILEKYFKEENVWTKNSLGFCWSQLLESIKVSG